MLNNIDNIYQITITTAEEAEQVIMLLKDVANWLKKNNVNQWASIATGDDDEDIKQSIHDQEMYCVKRNETIVATFTLYSEQTPWDRDLWGDLQDKAIYLHRLALIHSEMGSGLGINILKWIENHMKNQGINQLRLDCVQENKKLNTFYASNGFEKRGTNNGFTLYEKNLH